MRAYLITVLSYLFKPAKRKLIRLSYELKSKTGLEIGGPSSIFGLKGYFPVYVFADHIDGVNFSNETIWEGKIGEGQNFRYFEDKTGHQFIDEASELKNISSQKYDFVLSSHSLEHVANPVKALKRWNDVLKDGGQLVLILPDKEHTFDVHRSYTSFQHF